MRSDGRNRLRLTVGVLGAVGVLAAAVPVSASVQEQPGPDIGAACTPHELPLPAAVEPDNSVTIVTSDPSGRYIVGSMEFGIEQGRLLLWKDGELEAVLDGLRPDGNHNVSAAGVNGSGVVAGHSSTGTIPTTDRAWKYENGTYTRLQGGVRASDINENGDILGLKDHDSDADVIWPAGDPDSPRELPGTADASSISDQGVLVGSTADGERPVLWPDIDSTPRQLELPAGVPHGSAGQISGDWVVGGNLHTGLRWNLAEGTVEKLRQSFITSVNSDGDYSSFDKIYRTDGSVVRLPSPVDNGHDPTVSEVFDAGSDYVAAGSYVSQDPDPARPDYRPVAWTC